ncbi:MAG: Crp/Fnr family transcriptional regulator [Deltaproteobacteria bacterium]|jgi:CRP/FNR family transcriptional regulator|nr:Crp/Fnr family transcriptional regulator [Deltaproteobacteria bacterium]
MPCPCDNLKPEDCQQWSDVCVGNLWLFSGLKHEELVAVASRAHRQTFEPGEPVFSQGDPAKSIYLIKTGNIRLSRVMENGTEIIMDIRKPGDCLGEYILNDLETDYYYPVSAWCFNKVVTCGFSRKAFEDMILNIPAIALKVVKNMAGRIANLTERIEAMSQIHLEEKLYAVLMNVAREHGVKRDVGTYALDLQLTHEDLGFLVGAHRVSVTRIMKRLKESGKITNDGKLLLLQISQPAENSRH